MTGYHVKTLLRTILTDLAAVLDFALASAICIVLIGLLFRRYLG